MDDGILMGDMDDVHKAWTILQKEGPSVELHPNIGKCKLVWVSGVAHPENPFVGVESLNSSNFETLGAAVGDAKFCDDFVTTKALSKATLLASFLPKLVDSQVAFQLLFYCISFSRMVYHLRTTPPLFLSSSLTIGKN